jgi:hypothetical protein
MVLNLTGQEYIRAGHLGAALPDDNVLVGFLMHRTSFADPFLLQQGNDGSRNMDGPKDPLNNEQKGQERSGTEIPSLPGSAVSASPHRRCRDLSRIDSGFLRRLCILHPTNFLRACLSGVSFPPRRSSCHSSPWRKKPQKQSC